VKGHADSALFVKHSTDDNTYLANQVLLSQSLPLLPQLTVTTNNMNCFNMDPKVKYLLSLRAIRDRANVVGEIAKAGNLAHFQLHEDKLDDVVDFVASVIKVRESRNPRATCLD
jgi:hypothetical protein